MLPLSSLFELSEDKGKPALVYVYDADTDQEDLTALERRAFGREDLLVATKLFRCFRIEETSIDDKSRKEVVRRVPAYFVLDAKGNVVAEAAGPISARQLFRRMVKGFDRDKARRVKRIVKAYQDHLRELQDLEDDVAELNKTVAGLQERIADSDSNSARKQLEERKAELAQREKELAALEKRGEMILADEDDAVARR